MHEVNLPADLLSLIQSQRGKLHPFETLEMRRTAHLVIDMQNGFMEPGAPVEVPVAREIVPNINAISTTVRGPRRDASSAAPQSRRPCRRS